MLVWIAIWQLVRAAQSGAPPAKPSAAPVRPVIDDCYGTKIVDPCRYMKNLLGDERRRESGLVPLA